MNNPINNRLNKSLFKITLIILLILFICSVKIVNAQTLTLQGLGPYYQLTLPLSAQSQAQFTDLRDLQIRNQAGTAVPFAWLALDLASNRENKDLNQRVTLFAVSPNDSSKNTSNRSDTSANHREFAINNDIPLGLKIGADGQLRLSISPDALSSLNQQNNNKNNNQNKNVITQKPNADWVLDTHQITGNMILLRLKLDLASRGLFPFDLYKSDDLNQWTRVDSQKIQNYNNNYNNSPFQIARLEAMDGEKIELLDVELPDIRAKYLRLRFQSNNLPVLLSAEINSVERTQIAPRLIWNNPISASSCSDSFCDYPIPKNVSADSLRILLSEKNTLAQITISGLKSPSESQNNSYQATRHYKNPLYRLRPPRQNPISENQSVFWLNESLVYRLQNNNTKNNVNNNVNNNDFELESGDIPLNGGYYTHLRLQTRGTLAQLGAKPPQIILGTYPKALVFLAQGHPPYQLVWNQNHANSLLPLATLLPNLYGLSLDSLDKAILDESSIVNNNDANQTTINKNAIVAPVKIKKENKPIWLWAVLVLGLALLTGMAWSLLRDMRKSESN